MQTLTDRLIGWMSLALIVLFLGGCANSVRTGPTLPAIYITQSDRACLATETKRQLLKHNCKVDYHPKYCEASDAKL